MKVGAMEDDTRGDDGCSYSTLLKTICSLEKDDSGKPIRKCQRTQQVLRKCVGRPQEVVDSKVEITEEDASLRPFALDYETKPGDLWPERLLPSEGSVEFPFRGLFESRGSKFSGSFEDFVESAEDSVLDAFASFGWVEDQPGQQPPAPANPRASRFSWFRGDSSTGGGNPQRPNSQDPSSSSQKKPDYESYSKRIQEV